MPEEPMNWDQFVAACPEIAKPAGSRFENDQLVLLGTIRRDGSPRISPNEVDLAEGRLFLGMMWNSKKALDLLRDPRIVVHSVPSGRMNPGGDVKLYGRVLDERDPGLREAFCRAIQARIDWRPDEPYHLFSLDVESAAFIVFGEGSHALSWDREQGLTRHEVH
jgi:hypothetical protein